MAWPLGMNGVSCTILLGIWLVLVGNAVAGLKPQDQDFYEHHTSRRSLAASSIKRVPSCVKGVMCTSFQDPVSMEMRVLMFGGELDLTATQNETWILERTSPNNKELFGGRWKWRQIEMTSIAPQSRWKASLSHLYPKHGSKGGEIYLFGGSTSDFAADFQFFADVWKLDLMTDLNTGAVFGSWRYVAGPETLLDPNEPWPAPRRAHSGVTFGNTIIIFGGRDVNNTVLSDTWAYSVDRNVFVELAQFPGKPRKGHSAALFLGTTGTYNPKWSSTWPKSYRSFPAMIVFGGRRHDHYYNDVWALIFGPNGEEWILLEEGGSEFENGTLVRPSRRNHHSAIIRDGFMFIYGGRSSHASLAVYSDLWAFDIARTKWARIEQNNQADPSRARMEHCSVLAGKNQLFIIMGQDSEGNRRNDAYTYSLETGLWVEEVANQCFIHQYSPYQWISVVILFLGAVFVLYKYYRMKHPQGYRAIR